MPSSLDYTNQQPADNTSRTTTAAFSAEPTPQPAPLDFSAPTPGVDTQTGALKAPPFPFAQPEPSVVYTNQAGQSKKNVVKKQATELATSLQVLPAAPTASPEAPQTPTPDYVTQAQDLTKEASVATPGAIQQGPGGFQAATDMAQAEAKQFLDLQKQRETKAATTQSAMNEAANAAGVSAFYDEDAGVWINSSTGQPQIPPSTEPVRQDEKWGTVQGNIILQPGDYYRLTTGQAQAIEDAGTEAARPYKEAISDAKEQAKQSEADALVRGGQAGGFLSSQIAGEAATNSVGGVWAGAGGSLKRLEDEHTKIIERLKQEEAKAVARAKDFASTAARTGDAQYYDAANFAKRNLDEVRAKMEKASVDQTKQLEDLSKLQKLERTDATDTISSLVNNGYTDFDSLPEAYTEELDKHLQAGGMPPGSARMLFATAQKKLSSQDIKDAQERQKAEVGNAQAIVSLLKNVPTGKSITIAGETYTGLDKGSLQQGTESDAQGRTTHWSYDPDTKAVTTVDLGYIGKPSDGWTTVQTDQGFFNYNPKTKQAVPLDSGVGISTFQAAFPNGSQSPYRNEKDPFQGQCAAFTNDLYGKRIMGNTLQEKLNTAGGYPPVKGEDLQYGNTFIMSSGSTGHIGVVLDTKIGPDGKQMFLRGESNMVPPGGGKISSTEWMSVDDKRLKGFWDIPTPNLPQAGSDSPISRAVMSGQPTIGGKPIAEVLGGGEDKILSPSEAKDLGVPYGTTQSQAARMGITPGSVQDKILTVSEAKSLGVPYGTTQSQAVSQGITPGQIKVASAGIEIPSLEDFVRQTEKAGGKSYIPEKIKPIYDKTVGAIPSYLDASENLAYKFAGDKKGPAFIQDVQNAVKNGDFLRAQDKLKKAALDTVDATTQQKVRGTDNSIRALGTIENDLAAYKTNGGKTNIFTGTKEEITKKVGSVTDPELRKIATKIQAAIIDYRHAVSGAGFSISEAQQYSDMFPSISSSEELNLANISALKETFNEANASFYRQQLGNENYEAIF